MKKLFGNIRSPATIAIDLEKSPIFAEGQNIITVSDPHDQFVQDAPSKAQIFPLFHRDDPICGKVTIRPEKTFEHQGVKIELLGEIVTYYESKQTSQFTQLSKEVAPAGSISQEVSYDFQFKNVEKEFESYRGINADLRYYLKVTVTRSMFSMTKEQEFWVHGSQEEPKGEDPGISMEVGLEGIVLLSIKYDHVNYEISRGVIEGRLRFYLVNAKIDKAEVSIIKEETAGQGEFAVVEKEILKKFEIIDGTPAKDEVVPVRMYLSSIDSWKLTPTVASVNNKFSVKYFLHLALLDTKGRRFFKQREIVLWRDA